MHLHLAFGGFPTVLLFVDQCPFLKHPKYLFFRLVTTVATANSFKESVMIFLRKLISEENQKVDFCANLQF